MASRTIPKKVLEALAMQLGALVKDQSTVSDEDLPAFYNAKQDLVARSVVWGDAYNAERSFSLDAAVALSEVRSYIFLKDDGPGRKSHTLSTRRGGRDRGPVELDPPVTSRSSGTA